MEIYRKFWRVQKLLNTTVYSLTFLLLGFDMVNSLIRTFTCTGTTRLFIFWISKFCETNLFNSKFSQTVTYVHVKWCIVFHTALFVVSH